MVRLFRNTIVKIYTCYENFGEGLVLRCLNNPSFSAHRYHHILNGTPLYPPYEYGYRIHEISVTYNRKANILNRWVIASVEG